MQRSTTTDWDILKTAVVTGNATIVEWLAKKAQELAKNTNETRDNRIPMYSRQTLENTTIDLLCLKDFETRGYCNEIAIKIFKDKEKMKIRDWLVEMAKSNEIKAKEYQSISNHLFFSRSSRRIRGSK